MFETDIEKLAVASESKIKLMNRFPSGYLALSALAVGMSIVSLINL